MITGNSVYIANQIGKPFVTVAFLVSLLTFQALITGCSPDPETASAPYDTEGFRSGVVEKASDFKDQLDAAFEEMETFEESMPDDFGLDLEDQIADAAPVKKLTINQDFKKAKPPVMPPSLKPKSQSKIFKSTIAETSSTNSVSPRSGFGNPQAAGVRQFNKREPETERAMAVMAPAEIESDLPPSQTNIDVFYATDRQSKFGIAPGDWLNIHLGALISLAVYLVTFAGVFLSTRKAFFGTIAFGSLVVFLVLGQSANLTWQKQKRLASNNDPIYISDIRPAFSGEALDYGVCSVTIPPNHKVGHLDSPSLFKLEFSEDPENHVVLNRILKEDKDTFYGQLQDSIDESGSNQALVFIHGYNVSFENAVKRTAQIVHDLKFAGAPICYSWSSHGALADYTKDMANADATILTLQSFLEETVQRTGNATIHLVAHSMGNRAMLQALDRIAVGTAQQDKMFGQLVMAAPDVSVSDFQNRFAPAAMQLADSVTLYASSRDRALLASTKIHGHNRAGLAGDHLVVMDGMDTIDVSEIDTSLIGHSYYGDHPELIKDLRALVELSQPAANRKWLTRIFKPGTNADYFRFTQRESQAQIESEFK